MRFAIITPSYKPDFERCALLCESVEKYVQGDFHHYVIVDAVDRPLFSRLENAKTTLIEAESFLPWWIHRPPFGPRGVWISWRGWPIRGWILQQLIKLSVGEKIDADVYLFVDSDVTFIRPFDLGRLCRGDRVQLFRVKGKIASKDHEKWCLSASRLLGLPPMDDFGAHYVGNLITWRRDTLRRLYATIESTMNCPWLLAVSRCQHLSEYTLYGGFAEHVLGDNSGHYFDDSAVCHNNWNRHLATDQDFANFLDEVSEGEVSVMIHSKDRIPPELTAKMVRAFPHHRLALQKPHSVVPAAANVSDA